MTAVAPQKGKTMSRIRNMELLELIADLKMSDSKARQALGQEISRLVHVELAALEAVAEAARTGKGLDDALDALDALKGAE